MSSSSSKPTHPGGAVKDDSCHEPVATVSHGSFEKDVVEEATVVPSGHCEPVSKGAFQQPRQALSQQSFGTPALAQASQFRTSYNGFREDLSKSSGEDSFPARDVNALLVGSARTATLEWNNPLIDSTPRANSATGPCTMHDAGLSQVVSPEGVSIPDGHQLLQEENVSATTSNNADFTSFEESGNSNAVVPARPCRGKVLRDGKILSSSGALVSPSNTNTKPLDTKGLLREQDPREQHEIQRLLKGQEKLELGGNSNSQAEKSAQVAPPDNMKPPVASARPRRNRKQTHDPQQQHDIERLLIQQERSELGIESGEPCTESETDAKMYPFAQIVFKMVTETASSNPSVINWTADGNAFKITKTHKDLGGVLKKYFKHGKFSSLQRQLNMYGWKKHMKGRYRGAFYNPLFRRGCGSYKELSKIRRNAPLRKGKSQQKAATQERSIKVTLKDTRKMPKRGAARGPSGKFCTTAAPNKIETKEVAIDGGQSVAKSVVPQRRETKQKTPRKRAAKRKQEWMEVASDLFTGRPGDALEEWARANSASVENQQKKSPKRRVVRGTAKRKHKASPSTGVEKNQGGKGQHVATRLEQKPPSVPQKDGAPQHPSSSEVEKDCQADPPASSAYEASQPLKKRRPGLPKIVAKSKSHTATIVMEPSCTPHQSWEADDVGDSPSDAWSPLIQDIKSAEPTLVDEKNDKWVRKQSPPSKSVITLAEKPVDCIQKSIFHGAITLTSPRDKPNTFRDTTKFQSCPASLLEPRKDACEEQCEVPTIPLSRASSSPFKCPDPLPLRRASSSSFFLPFVGNNMMSTLSSALGLSQSDEGVHSSGGEDAPVDPLVASKSLLLLDPKNSLLFRDY